MGYDMNRRTFLGSLGALAAAEVTNVNASMARGGAPPAPLDVRLISAGHFVDDISACIGGTPASTSNCIS